MTTKDFKFYIATHNSKVDFPILNIGGSSLNCPSRKYCHFDTTGIFKGEIKGRCYRQQSERQYKAAEASAEGNKAIILTCTTSPDMRALAVDIINRLTKYQNNKSSRYYGIENLRVRINEAGDIDKSTLPFFRVLVRALVLAGFRPYIYTRYPELISTRSEYATVISSYKDFIGIDEGTAPPKGYEACLGSCGTNLCTLCPDGRKVYE